MERRMVMRFETDETLRQRIKKSQRNGTGLGRVRAAGVILWCLMLPVLFSFFYRTGNLDVPMREMSLLEIMADNGAFLCLMLTAFFWGTPLLCFLVVMDRLMTKHLNKLWEELVIDEEGIKNVYLPFDRTWDGQAEEVSVRFDEIRRLVWHERRGLLAVYGDVHYIRYSDYNNGIIARQGTLSGEDGFRYFYAYYHSFGEFMRQVQARSGAPMERAAGKEKIKREARIK